MSPPQIHPSTLTNLGVEVRERYHDRTDKCWHIASDLSTLVERRTDIPLAVVEVEIGDARASHYVNVLPAMHYTEADDGVVLVDASLTQFATENQVALSVPVDLGPRESLPAVAIYPSGAEERVAWYHRVNDPELTNDVFADRIDPTELTLNTSDTASH